MRHPSVPVRQADRGGNGTHEFATEKKRSMTGPADESLRTHFIGNATVLLRYVPSSRTRLPPLRSPLVQRTVAACAFAPFRRMAAARAGRRCGLVGSKAGTGFVTAWSGVEKGRGAREFQRGAVRLHILYYAAEEEIHGTRVTEELARHG